jgi:hypothetical protein
MIKNSLNLPAIKKSDSSIIDNTKETKKIPSLDLKKNLEHKKMIQRKEENLLNQFQDKRKGSLDLVLIGDLTGSMGHYHSLLKKEFTNLSHELFKMIPDLQIGIIFYIDHGRNDPYLTTVHKLSSDIQSIEYFISKTPTGTGEDIKEAVEDALYDALQLKWRPKVNRSIVLFGDASGKEPPECPCQHSYFQITKELFERGVTINSVFCRPGYSAQKLQSLEAVEIGNFSKKFEYPDHPNFFSWLANVTGGMIIGIEEVNDLIEIIKASAAKDAGVLDEYESSIKCKGHNSRRLELIEISKKASARKNLANTKTLRLE